MTSNKNILFKIEYASKLLFIAKGDLSTAKALIDSANPGRRENILYMIQQAVEKALKTVLLILLRPSGGMKKGPFPSILSNDVTQKTNFI